MSTNSVHDPEEPLMFEDRAKIEEPKWRLSMGSSQSQHGREVKSRTHPVIYLSIFLPWFLLIILGSWNWVRYHKVEKSAVLAGQLTYSNYIGPVQDLLEYEVRTFHSGLGKDLTEFVGEPSPELDKKWATLYPSLYQLIPEGQAARLWNKTSIFPHDKDRRYVIELEVFHQLHCLNMIRKSLRPDYYQPYEPPQEDSEDGLLGTRHLNHCIETLRQAIMCASDVTVYTFRWHDEVQSYKNDVTTPHTCRNFNRLRDWADVNGVKYKFDVKYREMNDPLDQNTWVNGYSGE